MIRDEKLKKNQIRNKQKHQVIALAKKTASYRLTMKHLMKLNYEIYLIIHAVTDILSIDSNQKTI